MIHFELFIWIGAYFLEKKIILFLFIWVFTCLNFFIVYFFHVRVIKLIYLKSNYNYEK